VKEYNNDEWLTDKEYVGSHSRQKIKKKLNFGCGRSRNKNSKNGILWTCMTLIMKIYVDSGSHVMEAKKLN
jgi:hypothetical protein